MGFPGGTSGKEPACDCRRLKRRRFNPGVGKILDIRYIERVLLWVEKEEKGIEGCKLKSKKNPLHYVLLCFLLNYG